MKLTAKEICLCAAACALMAVGAWISVPATVDFTLQTFAVALVACCLGPKLAIVSAAVYLLLGAVGAPVFAGFSGGISVLLGPTGGYIVGFFPLALLPGLLEKRLGKWGALLGLALGLLACYALGTAWFLFVYTRNTGPVALGSVLAWCVFPFILPDAAKLLLAWIAARRVKKAIKI